MNNKYINRLFSFTLIFVMMFSNINIFAEGLNEDYFNQSIYEELEDNNLDLVGNDDLDIADEDDNSDIIDGDDDLDIADENDNLDMTGENNDLDLINEDDNSDIIDEDDDLDITDEDDNLDIAYEDNNLDITDEDDDLDITNLEFTFLNNIQVSNLKSIDYYKNKVSARVFHSLAIKSDGSLWAWGDNEYGQLGNGTTTTQLTPMKVMDDIVDVSSGYSYSLATKSDGSLWAWGRNDYGQLGNGTTTTQLIPIKVMDDIIGISSGFYHSLAIKSDRSLWAWGQNELGQIGNGTHNNQLTPIKIIEDVIYVSAGGYYSLAIKSDGSLWAWGYNGFGQLGNGTDIDQLTPIKIMDNVINISAGDSHSLIIKSDGSLWTCGWNDFGQIGNNGQPINQLRPTKIMDDVIGVSAGVGHSTAIKSDSSLWVWGWNDFGQIGNDTTVDQLTPIEITDSVIDISAGAHHTLTIKSDGSLWAWGDNEYGQIGSDKITNQLTPIKIMDLRIEEEKEVESIKFTEPFTYLNINESKKLTYIIEPFDAINQEVSFISSNPSIVSVDDNGIVKGLKEGIATITVITENNISDNCTVVVSGSEIIPRLSLVIGVGEKAQYEFDVNDDITLTWFSEDPTIVSVDNNGLVKGITSGLTYINVSSTDNSINEKISIKVKDSDVTTPTVTKKVNDKDSKVTYNGSWTYYQDTVSGFYDNDEHYSNKMNDSVEFSFVGSSIKWIGAKSYNLGIADVYIDGVKADTIDLYADSLETQLELFSKSGLTNTNHTIKIVVTGTKNPSATDSYVTIDAFEYETTKE